MSSIQPPRGFKHIPGAYDMAGRGSRYGLFNRFIKHVSPSPLPTRKEFYWNGIREHFIPSYKEGGFRFFRSLKENPIQGGLVGLVAIGLGTMLTALDKLAPYARAATITALLVYPVMNANKNFPKIQHAYEQVRAGNPDRGHRIYRDAMDDSIYHILHAFLKPVSLAGTAAFIISLPKILTAPVASLTLFQRALGFPFRKLVSPEKWQRLFTRIWPFKGLAKLHDGLTRWGRKLERDLASRSQWVRKLMVD